MTNERHQAVCAIDVGDRIVVVSDTDGTYQGIGYNCTLRDIQPVLGNDFDLQNFGDHLEAAGFTGTLLTSDELIKALVHGLTRLMKSI